MSQKGINKVILIGNLGADPETRYMPDGKAVANMSLATSDSWKDKTTGQQKERTEWHRVVFFGKLAEIVGQYLRKGAKVYVEGRLQTRKWRGQDGQDRYTTEIVVDGFNGVMQMLDSRQGRGEASGYGQQSQPAVAPAPMAPAAPAPVPMAPGPASAPQQGSGPAPVDRGFDDDIPF